MARTHKGGPAPPRRDSSSSSGAAVPSPSSAAAPPRPATSGKNLHAPPRPPPAEMPTKGRHAVVFDEAMVSLLEDGTEDDDGDEEEWVGLKYKFKPSSTARSRLGTFTPEPSSGAVVHLEGSSKEDVHGFSAKLDDTIPGGGRDVLLVWDPDRLCFTLTPLARTYRLEHDKTLSRTSLPAVVPSSSLTGHPRLYHHAFPPSEPSSVVSSRANSPEIEFTFPQDRHTLALPQRAGKRPRLPSPSPAEAMGSASAPVTVPSSDDESPRGRPTAPRATHGGKTIMLPTPIAIVGGGAVGAPGPLPGSRSGLETPDAVFSSDDDDDDDEEDFAALLQKELAANEPVGAGGGGPSDVNGKPGAGGANGSAGPGPGQTGGKRPVSLSAMMMGRAAEEEDEEEDDSDQSSDDD